MANDGMFAPLTDVGDAPKRAAPKDPWRPILPITSDAPPAPTCHPRHGKPAGCWTYHDSAGGSLGQVWRFDLADSGKEFAPLTFCQNAATGARAWRFKNWSAPRPLYGLDRLAQRPSAPAVVCEGEKSADAAAELLPDHVAVTSPNGANSAAKADWLALAGRNVTIWPDHDDDGRTYAAAVARALCGVAESVRITSAPAGARVKWDAADALVEGWDQDRAAALIAAALPVPGGDAPARSASDDAAEIARLAALPPLQYEREREAAAKLLGCRTAILDRLVVSARGNGGAAGQGRPLNLHEPEPWPDRVDGAALLDALAAAIRRHVVLSAAEADAVALWALAVHAFEAFSIFPRLFVTAPEKQCGKSTFLDVIGHLVPRTEAVDNITAAALFRFIEAARPTLLLDEADSYARDNEDLRGVLDSGHRRNGGVIRTVGDDHEPRRFSTWAPIALAAIGHLPGTVEDRSIKIAMRRRRPDERVEQLRDGRTGHLEKLARMAARWTADQAAEITAADPAMPVGIVNRAADNWRPLLAVADLAGGAWPERARRAAVELSAEGDDPSSIRVALLADIRAAFAAKAVDRLSSDELATHLGTLDDRLWPEYRAGKPISKSQVARLLKPLRVSSGSIRLPDGSTPKGYHLAAFRDAFARYLPAENATTPQPQDFRGSAPDFKTPQGNGCGVSGFAEIPRVSAGCGVVADREPLLYDGEFAERSAIREYDGGYSRPEAERLARAELAGRREKSWLQ
jgi:hypothetical protein